MWVTLGKIILIIAIVLFIPTTLVLASQDTVPGDGMYPVKRKLEDVIIMVASLHPRTRAMFYTDFSKRRFTEAMAVIKKGGNGYQSLDELIAQTQSAASSVKNVDDKNIRRQLADNLLKQIAEYDNSLSKLDQNKKVIPKVTPSPTIKPGVRVTIIPTPTTIPQETSQTESNDYQQYLEDLEKLKKEVEDLKNAQTFSQTIVTPTLTPIPTETPTPTTTPTAPRGRNLGAPTITPTPTHFKSAFETLQQRSESSTSATESGVQISTSGGGIVQGISIRVREIDLQNLINSFRSLISIFK